jgi:AcrR family transcriptional regulator
MGTAERRQREKDRRRNEIIEAAEKVFFAKGYEATTVEDIAAAAELSKGTIYLYFEGKEDLHDAIVERGMEILSKMFQEAFEGASTGLEQIRGIGQAYMRFFRRHSEYFDALMRFETHKREEIALDDPMMLVIEALRKGIEDGSIRKGIDPVKMAVLLWGQTTGVLQNNHLKCEIMTSTFGIDCDEIIEYHMEQTFRMLTADPVEESGVGEDE